MIIQKYPTIYWFDLILDKFKNIGIIKSFDARLFILILLWRAHQNFSLVWRQSKYAGHLSISLLLNINILSARPSASKVPTLSILFAIKLWPDLQSSLNEDESQYEYIDIYQGFGYGKKTDLETGKHPHNLTPSPDNYQIDSFVETDTRHRRGMSTHIGREVSYKAFSLQRPEAISN